MISQLHDFAKFIIDQHQTITDAMAMIDKNKSGTLLVVNEQNQLVGSLTDGDIRRGLLRGEGMDSPLKDVMFTDTTFLEGDFSLKEAELLFDSKQIKLIPVLQHDRVITSVLNFEAHTSHSEYIDNYVVLMVGGEGTRLAPLTKDTPKPLLKVGNKPILQIILERLSFVGFKNVILCTNYRSDDFKDFCGDGSKFGMSISYYKEDQKLGTIGAVKFLEEKLDKPFLVMNGDLLTLLNYKNVLTYHQENKSDFTICSKEYSFTVPYGVLNLEGNQIKSISEKPTYSHRVSAGIYCLDPDLLKYIPKGEYYDITDLMANAFENQKKLVTFPIGEYWLDIGQHKDYQQANTDFYTHFDN